MVAKTPDFATLASSVSVPASKRGTSWDEVIRRTRRERAEMRADAFLDAEAYLVALAEATGVREIVSFDRSIDRAPSVRRREPSAL